MRAVQQNHSFLAWIFIMLRAFFAHASRQQCTLVYSLITPYGGLNNKDPKEKDTHKTEYLTTVDSLGKEYLKNIYLLQDTINQNARNA